MGRVPPARIFRNGTRGFLAAGLFDRDPAWHAPSMLPTPQQIRAARALLDLTQEEAAALVGVSPRTWTEVERGTASEQTVEKVMGRLMGEGVDFVASASGKRRGVRLRS